MTYSSILFISPKRGGILQSSGFLDLKSLVTLGQTAKSNVLDELSFIIFIESELTRHHNIKTMKEAIAFWRETCRNPVLRPWLTRDHSYRSRHHQQRGESIAVALEVTREMLSYAVTYEVMLAKMLRIVPETEILQLMKTKDERGKTLLQRAAEYGNHASLHSILTLYPESDRFNAVGDKDSFYGDTVLHRACSSKNPESIKAIIRLLPKSEHMRAVTIEDDYSKTKLLHVASRCGMILYILSLFPESEWLQISSIRDSDGTTALHHAAELGDVEAVRTLLSLYPESERLQAVRMKGLNGRTVFHVAAKSGNVDCINTVLGLYPESERRQALAETDRYHPAVYTTTGLGFAVRSNNITAVKAILAFYPASEHLQILTMRYGGGRTILNETVCVDTIRAVLALYPESERLRALFMQDDKGKTILHHMAKRSCHYLLTLLPDSERSKFVNVKDLRGRTVLHRIALQRDPVPKIEKVLSYFPESERLQAVCMQDQVGRTVLHYAAHSVYRRGLTWHLVFKGRIELEEHEIEPRLYYNAYAINTEEIRELLTLFPESERLQVLNMEDYAGNTIMRHMDEGTLDSIAELLPVSERVSFLDGFSFLFSEN